MPYDLTSSLVGYQPLLAGWHDLLTQHGAVPDAGTILSSYDTWAKHDNIDPNLAIAQACHECTYFTSVRWQDWNPAGLGVTSSTAVVPPFANADEGIRAHIEHLCCYVYTDTTCPCDHTRDADDAFVNMADRRHLFHDGITALNGLEREKNDPRGYRKWAFPGTDYLSSILAIVNSVGGTTTMSNVPTAADLGYPGQVHYASGSGEAMDIANVRWFVVHDTEGHFAGDESTLSGQISAHLLIDKTGEWRFMVPLDSVAYAAGNIFVNRQSLNVEHSGFEDAHDGGYTDPQYRCCAAFFRWAEAQGMTGVPATYIGKAGTQGGTTPSIPGILGHMDVPRDDGAPGWGGNYGHIDPGPTYDFARLIDYIGGAPPPPPPADTRAFLETGRSITGNIKGYWERFGTDEKGIDTSVELFGFPVTDLKTEDGFPTQYFERQVLEDHASEGKGVMGRRLGAEAAKAAGFTGKGLD